MTNPVQVSTGSRLHWGIIPDVPPDGRGFLGLGLMIESPGFELNISPASHDSVVKAPDGETQRKLVQAIAEFRQLAPAIESGWRIEVRQHIPLHHGFGAGTQLAYAVAAGLATASGLISEPDQRVEQYTSRMTRSSIGSTGFFTGGMLIDLGRPAPERPGLTLPTIPFPQDWPILLFVPTSRIGLSGQDESSAFSKLAPMPQQQVDRLSGLLLRRLIPAVREKNYPLFASSLAQFGDEVGDWFQPVQGGRYSNPLTTQIIHDLREITPACGQSSWGPTVYAVCQSQQHATQLHQFAHSQSWANLVSVTHTKAHNSGARIRPVAHPMSES